MFLQGTFVNKFHINQVLNYDGVSKNVTAVGFHEDGKWMYTGGEDCSARIWDLRLVISLALTANTLLVID